MHIRPCSSSFFIDLLTVASIKRIIGLTLVETIIRFFMYYSIGTPMALYWCKIIRLQIDLFLLVVLSISATIGRQGSKNQLREGS